MPTLQHKLFACSGEIDLTSEGYLSHLGLDCGCPDLVARVFAQYFHESDGETAITDFVSAVMLSRVSGRRG